MPFGAAPAGRMVRAVWWVPVCCDRGRLDWRGIWVRHGRRDEQSPDHCREGGGTGPEVTWFPSVCRSARPAATRRASSRLAVPGLVGRGAESAQVEALVRFGHQESQYPAPDRDLPRVSSVAMMFSSTRTTVLTHGTSVLETENR